MSDEVNTALANLKAIKDGSDPRANGGSSESTTSEVFSDPATGTPTGESMIADLRAELQATFDRYDFLSDHLSINQCHVYVANWKRRRGYCSYNRSTNREEFGSRLDRNDFIYTRNNHALGVARRIWEDDNDWQGTLRHEVAHAYLYEKHGTSQGHNTKFKRVNRLLDGSEKSKHKRENYKYATACPEGCWESGKMRRSKTVKKPFTRICNSCGSRIVSYDWDAEPPEEPGTCAVESIPWSDRREYNRHPTKRLS